MSGKPIEVDCRCVVVSKNKNNHGKVVTVVAYAGPPGSSGFLPSEGPMWRIDTPLEWVRSDGKVGMDYTATEGVLRRIDDDWGKTVGWGALKDIFQPHKETA